MLVTILRSHGKHSGRVDGFRVDAVPEVPTKKKNDVEARLDRLAEDVLRKLGHEDDDDRDDEETLEGGGTSYERYQAAKKKLVDWLGACSIGDVLVMAEDIYQVDEKADTVLVFSEVKTEVSWLTMEASVAAVLRQHCDTVEEDDPGENRTFLDDDDEEDEEEPRKKPLPRKKKPR